MENQEEDVKNEEQTKTEEDKQEQGQEKEPQKSPDEFAQRVLREKKNWQAKAQELESKLKQMELEQAEKAQDWQKKAEIYKTQFEEANTRLSEYQEKDVKQKKLAALQSELIKIGANREYMGTILEYASGNLNDVIIDQDTGVVEGADFVANKLKSKLAPMFGKTTAQVDSSAPEGAPKPMTYDAIREKYKTIDERTAAMADMMKAKGIHFRK